MLDPDYAGLCKNVRITIYTMSLEDFPTISNITKSALGLDDSKLGFLHTTTTIVDIVVLSEM